jgi:tripartite-type tricarboxylate transporter receptor subunit TctC
MTRRLTAVLLSVFFAIIVAEPPKANAVEDFYKGKTINLYVGYPPGGGYDIYARLVARFIGRHIPGNPSLVVRNMPGAGSRTAASYVANVVPKDGLSLGAVHQALALGQAMGDKGIKFDTSKFNWIGSPDADT